MIKKSYNTDLFEKLDLVLKKKKKNLNSESKISLFLFDRWLSMSDASIAQIINATTNRWILQRGIFNEETYFLNFFKVVLPKITKKFSYIKKATKEKNEKEYITLANVLEISEREIKIYEKTLAEIKNKTK